MTKITEYLDRRMEDLHREYSRGANDAQGGQARSVDTSELKKIQARIDECQRVKQEVLRTYGSI